MNASVNQYVCNIYTGFQYYTLYVATGKQRVNEDLRNREI